MSEKRLDVECSRHRANRGFTLIELVVVITIVGVLAVAASNAIIVILRNNVSVSTRVDDNRDLIALATWFPQDVNSTPTASALTTADGDISSQCTGGTVGTPLVRLTWSEKPGTNTTDTYQVSYQAVNSGGSTTIKRVSCTNFGVASIATASKALPLKSDGTLPLAVDKSGSTVTLSVIQHPGAANQNVVKINAVSKNPATATVDTLPPPPPPPAMGLSLAVVDAGSSVSATLSNFPPGEPITFYIDNPTANNLLTPPAAVTTDGAGAATSGAMVIPLSATRGDHKIWAYGSDTTASYAVQSIYVNNGTVILAGGVSNPSILVGGTIDVDLSGFDINDLVTLKVDNLTVIGDPAGILIKQNTKTETITIPQESTTGGFHTIWAIGSTGRQAFAQFFVQSTFALAKPTAYESRQDDVSTLAYGLAKNETVTYRLDANGPTLGVHTADDNGFDTVKLTIPAFTTLGAHDIYALRADGTILTTPVQVIASPREYDVIPLTSTVTAGSAVSLQLQAKLNGVNDPSLGGDTNGDGMPDPVTVTITITGAANSPNGTAPTGLPTTAIFTNGVAVISVPLVNASPTTVVVSNTDINFPQTGTSTAVIVNAAAPRSLAFATACPSPTITTKWTSGVDVLDVYGNLANGVQVTLTFSPAVGSSSSVSALDFSGWTTVTANASYTAVTDANGRTPSFTATGPKGNAHKPSTNVTAAANGYSVTCVVNS